MTASATTRTSPFRRSLALTALRLLAIYLTLALLAPWIADDAVPKLRGQASAIEQAVAAVKPDPRIFESPHDDSLQKSIVLGIADDLRTHATVVELAAKAGLGIALLLPTVFLIVMALLTQHARLAGQLLPRLIAASVLLLAVMLLLQGVAVLGSALGLYRLRGSASLWILCSGGIGVGLIVAGAALLHQRRQLSRREPVRVTGVLTSAAEAPALYARIERIAARLAAPLPEHVIVGIAPGSFVVAAPVSLRGNGELPAAMTLYVSALDLRTLTAGELDAVIGHELAHFRAGDVHYSARVAPAINQLVNARYVLQLDDSDEHPLVALARVPAIAFVELILLTLLLATARFRRAREAVADRAAQSVASSHDVVSGLLKVSLQQLNWHMLELAYAGLLRDGKSRRNLVTDAVTLSTHTELTPGLTDALFVSRQAHPLDQHPILKERAALLGVPLETLLGDILATKVSSTASDTLDAALEEAATQALTRALAPTGLRIVEAADDQLPAEYAALLHPDAMPTADAAAESA